MIRLSRLADYGVILMTHIASSPESLHTASAVAGAAHVPEPTAAKILKALSRHGLLESHRGAGGGYELARVSSEITAAEIIVALDGPIALTECLDEDTGPCVLETFCPTRGNLYKINQAIHRALDDITLADLVSPFPLPPLALAREAHDQ
jgi:FeS assembly SUF system regulator